MSHFRSQRNVKVGAQAGRRGHPTWATADYATPLLYLRNRDGLTGGPATRCACAGPPVGSGVIVSGCWLVPPRAHRLAVNQDAECVAWLRR